MLKVSAELAPSEDYREGICPRPPSSHAKVLSPQYAHRLLSVCVYIPTSSTSEGTSHIGLGPTLTTHCNLMSSLMICVTKLSPILRHLKT